MKKALSLILCFVIMLVSVTISGIIPVTGESASNNLLADADVSAWGAHNWNNPANYAKAVLQNTDDSRYGGKAIYNYNVGYQNLYIGLPTEADGKYNLSFSVKTNKINRVEICSVSKGAQLPWTKGGALDSSSSTLVTYASYKDYTTAETEWTDISISFKTNSTENIQYYMNILFGDGGTSNAATVSDISLVK